MLILHQNGAKAQGEVCDREKSHIDIIVQYLYTGLSKLKFIRQQKLIQGVLLWPLI